MGRKIMHGALLSVLTLLVPGSLLAQAPRIAVINFQQVVTQSAEGRAAGAELQLHYEDLSVELQQLQTTLTSLQEQKATQERVLSPTALGELNRNIQTTQTRLARRAEDAEMEMAAKEDELFQPIFEKAQLVFEQYASEQNYDLIFNSGAAQSGLIYAAETIDITTEIIRRLDAVPGAGNAPPAAPAP